MDESIACMQICILASWDPLLSKCSVAPSKHRTTREVGLVAAHMQRHANFQRCSCGMRGGGGGTQCGPNVALPVIILSGTPSGFIKVCCSGPYGGHLCGNSEFQVYQFA
jgi:hypothetical protein